MSTGAPTVRRPLLVGLVAIGLLGLGSLLAVLWASDGQLPAETPSREDPQPAAGVPATAAAPPPVAAVAPRTAGGLPPPPPRPGRPSPEDAAVAAAIKRPAHRANRGAPAPVDLFAGLERLQARVSSCAPSRAASSGASKGPAGQNASQTVLMLDLETLDGKVRIVEAPVQSRGAATDQSIACAQGILLGEEIPVKAARAGSHVQMPFTARF